MARDPSLLTDEQWELIEPLYAYAHRIGVRFVHHAFITRLLCSGNRVCAATGIYSNGCFVVFKTRAIVLATGGYARIYLHSNNATGITGDGLALAYDLGLELKDLEFVQFYPTALGRHGGRLLLYEDFVMHAGAVLKNKRKEDIPLLIGHLQLL